MHLSSLTKQFSRLSLPCEQEAGLAVPLDLAPLQKKKKSLQEIGVVRLHLIWSNNILLNKWRGKKNKKKTFSETLAMLLLLHASVVGEGRGSCARSPVRGGVESWPDEGP